jgi:hypothetical protein
VRSTITPVFLPEAFLIDLALVLLVFTVVVL